MFKTLKLPVLHDDVVTKFFTDVIVLRFTNKHGVILNSGVKTFVSALNRKDSVDGRLR